MSDFFVSVVCASRNEEIDILGLCRSFHEQQYPNKELIIVDDSTDSTKEKVRVFIEENAIENIFVLDGERDGCCPARNMGVKKAIGEIICYMTADSFFPDNNYLALVNDEFCSNIDIYMPNSVVANQSNMYADFVHCWQQEKLKLRGDAYSPLTSQGYCVRKKAALEVGLIDQLSDIKIPFNVCRDWTLVKKLDAKGYKKKFDKHVLVPHVAPASFADFFWTHKQRGAISAGYNLYFRRISRIYFFIKATAKISKSIFFYIMLFPPYMRSRTLIGHSRHNRRIFEFIFCDAIKTFSFHYGEIYACIKSGKHV